MIIAQAPAQVPAPIVSSINPAEIITCPAVTSFIKRGAANNAQEVANVQSILKNIEQLPVTVDGHFDERTEEAVKAFQRKYMAEVMAPWGATRPSGIINITTAKKLNQVGCLIPMTLDTAELASINAYKAKAVLAEVSVDSSLVPSVVPVPPVAPLAPLAPVAPAVSENDSSQPQTGNVRGKFVDYLRGLFGK